MTVFLRQSRHAGSAPPGIPWFAVTGTPAVLSPELKLPGLAQRLEDAFVDIRDLWWRLGREIGADHSAEVSHTAACGTFGSDFGLMLAWVRLVKNLAGEDSHFLILCDDPWLFRCLTRIPGIDADRAPPIVFLGWKLAVRGFLARVRLAVRLFSAWTQTRPLCPTFRQGDPTILVYGHPGSDANGYDAYFGGLMTELPVLRRMLHSDCPPTRALKLSVDGRTASVHGWGNPLFALKLIFERWTPRLELREGAYGWLIRRAAVRENSGGGPAMNRWQIHCQGRWLAATRPRAVAWPWENHAWERALCRQARRLGIRTVGYQHTVIGPHQINYAIYSNPDGAESIPDTVVADGPAYYEEMRIWGIPAERLAIGGAFRFDPEARNIYDPSGPVFVPLSAVHAIASRQFEAAQTIAATGRRVLVKEHPMYPFPFTERGALRGTNAPLARQTGLSAVVYATGTSGLEALLAGVPAFRLLADDRLSIDVLPSPLMAIPVERNGLLAALNTAKPPRPVAWNDILAPIDWPLWRHLLGGATDTGDRSLPSIPS